MHVEEVAGALVQLLESRTQGAVNIGSGQGTSVREFISQAAAIAGYSEHAHLGARQSRQDEPPSIVADIARLREEVGFQARYSLEQGLEEALSHG